jgi:hypothetical protein
MRGRSRWRLAAAVALACAGAGTAWPKDPAPPKAWTPSNAADARAKCVKALEAAAKEAEKKGDRTAAHVLGRMKAWAAKEPEPPPPAKGSDAADSAWVEKALEPARPSAAFLAASKEEDDAVLSGLVTWAGETVRGVRVLNAYRRAAGVPELLFDAAKCEGCVLHARYMVMNGYDVVRKRLGTPHDEGQGDPYATERGRAAARVSVMAQEPMDLSIERYVMSYYHRPCLFVPAERTVSMGKWKKDKEAHCIRLGEDPDPEYAGPTVVCVPGKDQTSVPRAFDEAGERPDPVPDLDCRRVGFPITITAFAGPTPITGFEATLTGKGGPVECRASSPEKPVNPSVDVRFGDLTMGLIPVAPLAPSTKYTVTAKCLLGETPWSATWSFTTR